MAPGKLIKPDPEAVKAWIIAKFFAGLASTRFIERRFAVSLLALFEPSIGLVCRLSFFGAAYSIFLHLLLKTGVYSGCPAKDTQKQYSMQ